MVDTTLIERAARAMSRGAQNRVVGADLRESEPWQAHRELTVDREWHHYAPFVRDVLEAIREPDWGMCQAGAKIIEDGTDLLMTDTGDCINLTKYAEVFEDAWGSCIDAALAEGGTNP